MWAAAAAGGTSEVLRMAVVVRLDSGSFGVGGEGRATDRGEIGGRVSPLRCSSEKHAGRLARLRLRFGLVRVDLESESLFLFQPFGAGTRLGESVVVYCISEL